MQPLVEYKNRREKPFKIQYAWRVPDENVQSACVRMVVFGLFMLGPPPQHFVVPGKPKHFVFIANCRL